MYQGINLVSSNIPGYGQSNGGCLICSRGSGVAAVSSYSFRGDLKPFPPIRIMLMKSHSHVSKRASIICLANSNNHRRNPDFSRQNRQNPSFSRNKNRSNVDRENQENSEESELLSSKNGPIASLSSSPRYQATATPGPREKEIVELFRKVQAQLRERAAMKEEKKIEAASQGQGRESETVDSLLKLLRKHSVDQGKKKNSSSSSSIGSGDDGLDQTEQKEQKSPLDEEHSTSLFVSNSSVREEAQEPNVNTFKRPPSNFRRISPVPRVKYQPVISVEEKVDSVLPPKSKERNKKIVDELDDESEPESEIELDPVPVPEADSEADLEPYLVSSGVHHEVYDEMSESEFSEADEVYVDEVVESPSLEQPDLSALKVSELRELAKSRGVKGFYKLKKGELLELLSRSSS